MAEPAQLAIRRDFQRPSADEIAPFLTAPTGWVVRDIEGINQVGMPTFAQGLSPNSPFKDGPGEIGGTISLGDVMIGAGDLLVGDIDGVVVVPRTNVRTVGAGLKAIAEKEAKMEAVVKSGAKYPAWLDDILDSDRVRYIDYVD